MPKTHRTWPTSGVPISQIPPSEVIEMLRIYQGARWIPEVVRAIQMIEHLAAEVERLGGETVRASLFDNEACVSPASGKGD